MVDGKLLWGEDVKNNIPRPTRKREVESARNYLKAAVKFIPKWEGQIGNITKEDREHMTRQAFCMIFRSSAIALCGNGVYISGKEEMVGAFKKTYPNEEELHKVLSWSLELWKKWKTESLPDEETDQPLKKALRFVKKLATLV